MLGAELAVRRLVCVVILSHYLRYRVAWKGRFATSPFEARDPAMDERYSQPGPVAAQQYQHVAGDALFIPMPCHTASSCQLSHLMGSCSAPGTRVRGLVRDGRVATHSVGPQAIARLVNRVGKADGFSGLAALPIKEVELAALDSVVSQYQIGRADVEK